MRRPMTVLLALLVATPLAAAPGGWGHPGGRGPGRGEPGDRFERRAERIADLLKLDESQRAAFERMRTAGREAARPKIDEMRALRGELHALLDSGSTDAQAIGEKTLAIHQLRDQLRSERQAAEAEFVKLLNDEQRFAFEAFRESRQMRRGLRGRHGGRGFGPGPGPGGPDELD